MACGRLRFVKVVCQHDAVDAFAALLRCLKFLCISVFFLWIVGAMSLLDTLPDNLVEGGELAIESNSLLETLDAVADPELAMLLEEVPHEDGELPQLPVEAGPATAVQSEPPREKKRRRRVPKRAPDAAPPTRSEICAAAAQARWAKQRPQKESLPEPAGLPRAQGPATVEVPAEQLQVVLRDSEQETSAGVVATFTKPIPENCKGREAKAVRRSMIHLTSYSAIGRQLKMDRKTIQRKMRLQASIMYFSTVTRMWSVVMATHHFLQSLYADFKACFHLLKQSYDEVQLALRVSEIPQDMPLWVSNASKREVIMAKLEQVNTEHIFLFRANDVHFALEFQPPTLLVPIESTHGECISAACAGQERGNSWAAQAFAGRGRMTIADNHSSNGLSDYYLYMLDWARALLRWICQIHAGHKICELQWATFPSDLRGMMAATLLVRYPGKFSAWKKGCKAWFRAKCKRVLRSDVQPLDAEAQAYRTSLFKWYGHGDDSERLSGPKAKARRIWVIRKRKLYSGDCRKLDVIEHICDGIDCCLDLAATIKAFCDDIDEETTPELWAENRWIGSEDSFDWHSFWMNCNCIYVAGFLIGVKGVDLDRVQSIIIALVNAEVAQSASDERVSFSETTKEMTLFERQTTHVANTCAWVESLPFARQWIFKPFMHAQQNHQKALLRLSGKRFELEQLVAISKGKAKKYRPVVAFDGELTRPTLKEYGRFLVGTEPWEGLPVQFHIHSVAMAGFRVGSRSICSLAELELFRNRTYPCKYFSNLRGAPEESVSFAKVVISDFRKAPCTFDAWSYHQTQRFPTLGEFLSPEHTSLQVVTADKSELVNAVVESNNASVRRRIKMHVQQSKPEMQDVQADWIVKQGRLLENGLYGEGDTSDESEVEAELMEGGGGGRFRAWLSLNKDDFKFPNGKIDFRSAAAEYNMIVNETPDCDELRLAEDLGRLATKATRGRFESGEVNYDVSVFGTARPRAVAAMERQAQDRELLADYDERVRLAKSVVTDQGRQLALLHRDPLEVISDLVIARSGFDLKAQVETMSRLSLAVARRTAAEERKVLDQLKAFVNQKPCLSTIDFSQVQLPELGSLKMIANEVPTLHYHDNSLEFAQRKAEQITREPGAMADLLLDQFERRSRMVLFDSCTKIPTVPPAYRPTYCFKHGAGICLCAGRGILIDIWRRKTSGLTLLLCPAGQPMRYLLMEGWLFIRFDEEHFAHCGLVYLSPQRITYLKVHLLREFVDGRCNLQVRLADDDMPEVLHETDLAQQLPLERPLRLRLYKLLSFEQAHIPFALGSCLLVEPLDKSCRMVTNDCAYWNGEEAEIRDETIRRMKKAEQERKTRQAAAAKAKAAPSPAPAGGRQPRQQHRPQQRPADCGLPPLQDVGPLSGGDLRPDPAASVGSRLMEDGQEVQVADVANAGMNMDDERPEFPGSDAMRSDWAAALREGLPSGDFKFRHSKQIESNSDFLLRPPSQAFPSNIV